MSLEVQIPAAALLFFLVGLVWPVVRLWRQTGVFGIVVGRGADPFQAFVGAGFGAAVAAVGVWALLFPALGAARMGVWPTPPGVTVAGWAVFAAGFALTVAAQANLGRSWRIGIDDRPTGLVRTGLYAWVRNPIYTGIFTMLAGLVAVAPSAWSVMGYVLIYVLLGLQTRLEEQHLLRQHGDAFRAWASEVGRFLPGVGRLDVA